MFHARLDEIRSFWLFPHMNENFRVYFHVWLTYVRVIGFFLVLHMDLNDYIKKYNRWIKKGFFLAWIDHWNCFSTGSEKLINYLVLTPQTRQVLYNMRHIEMYKLNTSVICRKRTMPTCSLQKQQVIFHYFLRFPSLKCLWKSEFHLRI